MFSDKVLEQIFSRDEVIRIPCEYKSNLVHAVEEVLEKEGLLKEVAKDNGIRK